METNPIGTPTRGRAALALLAPTATTQRQLSSCITQPRTSPAAAARPRAGRARWPPRRRPAARWRTAGPSAGSGAPCARGSTAPTARHNARQDPARARAAATHRCRRGGLRHNSVVLRPGDKGVAGKARRRPALARGLAILLRAARAQAPSVGAAARASAGASASHGLSRCTAKQRPAAGRRARQRRACAAHGGPAARRRARGSWRCRAAKARRAAALQLQRGRRARRSRATAAATPPRAAAQRGPGSRARPRRRQPGLPRSTGSLAPAAPHAGAAPPAVRGRRGPRASTCPLVDACGRSMISR